MAYSAEKNLPVAWLDENSFYCSGTARVRTPDFPHNMTMCKESYLLIHEAIEVGK